MDRVWIVGRAIVVVAFVCALAVFAGAAMAQDYDSDQGDSPVEDAARGREAIYNAAIEIPGGECVPVPGDLA